MKADTWEDGTAYESYVGRWSRLVASRFLRWLPIPPRGTWLDFGCGTGALTRTILTLADPRVVVGCDRSKGFVAFARAHTPDDRAEFVVAELPDLPRIDTGFDAVVAGLVLNFLPVPLAGVTAMMTRSRPGGTVAAYVWDYAEGMQLKYARSLPPEHRARLRDRIRQRLPGALDGTISLTARAWAVKGTVALLLGLVASVGRAGGQSPPCSFDTTAAWARVSRTWSDETGLRWSNDSLRRVLLALRDRDQAPRAEFGARVTDTLYARQLLSLDSTLAAEMDVILDRYGLPTRSMVGPAGSDAAMLVIQHNWPLQERVLALAAAIPPGEISLEKLAMLEDRVLVHRGKPQRFGTQFNAGSDGVFRLAPTSETAGLEARRSAAGMPPLAQYVCLLEEAGMRVDRGSLPKPRPLSVP